MPFTFSLRTGPLRAGLAATALALSLTALTVPTVWAEEALTPAATARNIETATAFYSLINGGDAAAWREIFADDWTATPPMPAAPDEIAGYESVIAAFRAGVPDLKVTAVEVIANEDVVAVRSTVSGTNTAPLFGQPATNAQISFTAMDIHRIVDGKIAETWHVEDFLTMQSQLAGN